MSVAEEAAEATPSEDIVCDDRAERDAGILRYVTPDGPRLAGVLKSRFSDFVVHEVSPDGAVVVLRAIPQPPPPSSEEPAPKEEAAAADDEAVTAAFAAVVGAEQAARFVAFARAAESPAATFAFAAEGDRERRAAVHALVRRHFPASLRTTTGGGGCVVAERGAPETRRQRWPRGRPKHVAFTLFKENVDGAGAVQLLSRRLGVPPNALSCAGNKDKRAVTTQRMTARLVDADRLARAVNGRVQGVLVGDCAYVDAPIRLGDLRGNRFELAVRDFDAGAAAPAAVAGAVAALQERGFVNYFGLQRFGTGTVRTHEIGVALLRGEWDAAVRLVMHPHNRAVPEAVRARELFLAGDLEGCARMLPRAFHIERTVVQGLLEHGAKAFRQAIDSLPRTTRMLYLHAYQSFVWNHMATRRLDVYGQAPVAGDLVLLNEEEGEVRAISEEEAKSGRFTLCDVVLPLPGTKSVYPSNQMASEYDQMLAKDGISRETFAKLHGFYQLAGGYRAVIAKPEDVEWKIVSYIDPTLPLIATDADRARGLPLPTFIPDNTPGAKRALLIAFTLRSSCYATMCYRELLKQHTSAQYQTTLEQSSAPQPQPQQAAAAVVDEKDDEAPPPAKKRRSCLLC